MRESRLGYMVDPIREMLYQSTLVLQGYKEKNNVFLTGLTCDFLPMEILAAAGMVPLRIPAYFVKNCCCGAPVSDISGLESYDWCLVPASCSQVPLLSKGALPLIRCNVPAGYGENAARALHHELDSVLKKAGLPGIDALEDSRLRDCADEYNTLRRIMRGITGIRRSKPDLLSNEDLQILIEAAAVFPPETVIEHLARILKDCNETESGFDKKTIPAMVYTGFIESPLMLDEIEEEGLLIAEDDSCNGRRQFDLSVNIAAKDLYDEILDAFTYRPLCPSIRNAEERHELLYKMLKSHGIETVVFFEENCCVAKKRQIEFLRVRLMRSGVDPLVVNRDNAVEIVRDYIKRR